MLGQIKPILYDADSIVKRRLKLMESNEVSMSNIEKALGGGTDFQARRKALEQKNHASSWLLPVFEEWFANAAISDDPPYPTTREVIVSGSVGQKEGAKPVHLLQLSSTLEL